MQGDRRFDRSGSVIPEGFLIGEGVVACRKQTPQSARGLPPGRYVHARGLLAAVCEYLFFLQQYWYVFWLFLSHCLSVFSFLVVLGLVWSRLVWVWYGCVWLGVIWFGVDGFGLDGFGLV